MDIIDDVISVADDFCKRIRSRELVLLPKAESTILVVAEGKDSFGRSKKEEYTLAFLLGKRMTEYQALRDITLSRFPQPKDSLANVLVPMLQDLAKSRLRNSALDLLEMIDQANTHGVIREENLEKRFSECTKESEQLKEENDKLRKENQRLQKLNKELHKTLDKFGKTGNVSDVSSDNNE